MRHDQKRAYHTRNTKHLAILTSSALLAVALLACGAGAGDLEEVDPAAVPDQVTYEAHVAPLMERYCTACHDPDSQAGEQEGYGYETCRKVRAGWEELAWTAFEEKSMPPGGANRVSSTDRVILQRWHDEGARCP